MNNNAQANQLIAEYERLRRRALQLFREWNEIDQRLMEIEDKLPDEYMFPGDPTLNAESR